MITKLADIVSISARYQELFSEEERVIDALAMLHLQVLKFLQRIRAVIVNRCEQYNRNDLWPESYLTAMITE